MGTDGATHRSGRANGRRLSISDAQLRDRRVGAVDMRVRGATYNEIAIALGISYQTARDDVRIMLAEREAEAVPALRQIESDRLDWVIRKAVEIVEPPPGPDGKPAVLVGAELRLKALDRIISAARVRAALHGLNAPLELSVNEQTPMGAEIIALVGRVAAANGQVRNQIEGEARVTSEEPGGLLVG